MNQDNESNDEIDLKDLFLILWRNKIFMLIISIFSVSAASFYLQSAERKYTIEYNLKAVDETTTASKGSGLGGFASIAGIELPKSSNTDLNIFKALLTSVEVSEIIFEDKKIVRDIFGSEWNDSLKNYSKQQKSKFQTLLSDIKRLLTGNKEANYMPPNPKRLSIFMAKNFQINEDKETGFLKLTSETSRPKLILSLIIKASEVSDKIMRQRYIDFSTEPLLFYKEKLRTARSREHREALAELIGKEEQKLMFASRGKYFVAEPYINPKISQGPTTPKPKMILLLSLIFGLFTGTILALFRHSLMKDK